MKEKNFVCLYIFENVLPKTKNYTEHKVLETTTTGKPFSSAEIRTGIYRSGRV